MDLSILFPLIIVLLFIPLFLSARKQRRQVNEMQKLQSSLSEGDVVMTTSGLRGTIVDASYEDTIDIEIAEGVVTTWVRAAVRQKVEDTDATAHPTAVTTTPAAAEPAADTTEQASAEQPREPAAPATSLVKQDAPSSEKQSDSANGATRS